MRSLFYIMLVGLLPSIGMAKNECGDVGSRLYRMLQCHKKTDKHLLCGLLKYCGDTGTNNSVTDCRDVLNDGKSAQSGVYSVVVDGAEHDVYCEMDLHGGGWTVFQKRFEGSVDFNRSWADYEAGFGDLNGEFWLGNSLLSQLVAQYAENDLLIRMVEFDGEVHYIMYRDFLLGNASTDYTLEFGSRIGGNATDEMAVHDRQPFSTPDVDNTEYQDDCATLYNSGWWFYDCFEANLNGLYLPATHADIWQGIIWESITGDRGSLQATDMMYRPSWADYEAGFGDLNGEFWLGNSLLSQLVAQYAENDLLIRMVEFDGEVHYIMYRDFLLGNASTDYTLEFGSRIGGNATDEMAVHDRQPFSTPDVDNTEYQDDCATLYNSGWWFYDCFEANLNGLYLPATHADIWQGIIWESITGDRGSLQATDMMYRPSLAN
ncbi:hypothetical protein ScPMuIL_002538 [Solemya velum]